jgi:hypothetical protein
MHKKVPYSTAAAAITTSHHHHHNTTNTGSLGRTKKRGLRVCVCVWKRQLAQIDWNKKTKPQPILECEHEHDDDDDDEGLRKREITDSSETIYD